MSTQLVVATKYRKSRGFGGKFDGTPVKLEKRAYDPSYIEDQNLFTEENGVYFEIDEKATAEHHAEVAENTELRKQRLAMSGISAESLAKALVGNMNQGVGANAPKEVLFTIERDGKNHDVKSMADMSKDEISDLLKLHKEANEGFTFNVNDNKETLFNILLPIMKENKA